MQDELKARYKSLSNVRLNTAAGIKLTEQKRFGSNCCRLKPYPDDLDEKVMHRGVVFYYPLEDDPSLLTEEEKADKGFIRVFIWVSQRREQTSVCTAVSDTHMQHMF